MRYVNPKQKSLTTKILKMKKLGKLSINVDKIIKNEELVNLKGGYYIQCGRYRCQCAVNVGSWEGTYCDTDEIGAALDEYCDYGYGDCTLMYLL